MDPKLKQPAVAMAWKEDPHIIHRDLTNPGSLDAKHFRIAEWFAGMFLSVGWPYGGLQEGPGSLWIPGPGPTPLVAGPPPTGLLVPWGPRGPWGPGESPRGPKGPPDRGGFLKTHGLIPALWGPRAPFRPMDEPFWGPVWPSVPVLPSVEPVWPSEPIWPSSS